MKKVPKSGKLILLSFVLLTGFFAIKSNYLLKLLYKDKIWAHHVNTIEKLQEVSEHYAGVELDVVFREDTSLFDIHHPPEPSKNIYLKDYLPISNKNLLYWLDFKNLNKDNAIQSSLYLSELCEKMSIATHRIIVESTNVQYLHLFQDKGFKTCFYLPPLTSLEKSNLNTKIRELQQTMIEYPTTMISSNSAAYGVMKEYFPEKLKNLWLLIELDKINSLRQRLTLLRRILDKNVKIILFKT